MSLPRVTDILAELGLYDFSMVPPAVLEAKREIGSAVHSFIEAATYGYLDERELTPETVPYFAAYKKFCRESGYLAERAEFEVVHDVWRYRGHPDSVGLLKAVRIVPDFKTGAGGPVKYQLAAYVLAYNHQHPEAPVQGAAAVLLRKDGTYRYNEVDLTEATPKWLAIVTTFYIKREEI